MENLDNYLKTLKSNLINRNELLNRYIEFGYDNDDEMFLDLDILLSSKYHNIKIVCNKLKRENQNEFRKDIIKRDKNCVITGTGKLCCEAAHIIPFSQCSNDNKYDIDNGLLLESGIHKLFDKYLWSINNNNKIVISNEILNDESYNILNKHNNKLIKLNKNQMNNMINHYEIFLSSNI